ncbi:xylose-binding protein [Marinilabilia salmonicolor]|jgi:D-xylose ABC transporter substrate-binding protein|uniref:D-xylose ABC transporter substrate-binding protein n=1 Tax=Marinilabilia salmonicolor TaxID=989 RepID=UPI000D07CC25|nr:substrate-binding domain-containing protein [Marinilabilia salmonicolor]PRY98195.1 xylose-binding protein [Marinilabilia salmonicolor]
MKAFRYLLSTLLLVALLTSCSDKPKIGFLMDTLEIERWQKDKELFEKKIEEMGGTLIVSVAEGNSPKQLEQAMEMIYDHVDVLVVIPVDLYSSRDIVREAHKKDIPVISYDRMIRDCDVDYYVSTDNINIGELQADYLSRIIPVGKYALLGGPQKDNNAALLHLGWMNVLQPLIQRKDIEVVLDQYVENWNADEAYVLINDYLNGSDSDLDAIIAGNDELAGGAIRALQEHNLQREVLVAGQDADLEAIRNIVAGYQTITIFKPIDAMAHTAAEMAIKMAEDEEKFNTNVTVHNGFKLVPSVLLSAQVVDRQNIKMTVVSEGFVNEEEIYEYEVE